MAKARAPTSSAGRVLAVMVVVLWMMLRSVEAATYVVGDATGWSNAVNGASFYSAWASSKTFQVDDVLVFNFISGKHDVSVVSESDFTSCNTSSAITFRTTPPVNFTLTTTGALYFTCTHDSHCSQGQKLSVMVGTASGPPGTSTSSNSGTGFMYASCRVMFTSMAIYFITMW
ncbi:hypothetical protein NL676_033231 [Syzygium grande]|nr:hypothetical protein NL676_033231 [Syzygium grande]